MNLESKSDFELEVILHVLRNNHNPKCEANERQRIYLIDSDTDQLDVVSVPRYCTDCNATIPIAFENKISIRWLDGVECWVADQVFDDQLGVYSSFSQYQKNIGGELFEQSELRTIVICLIKVLSRKTNLEIAREEFSKNR